MFVKAVVILIIIFSILEIYIFYNFKKIIKSKIILFVNMLIWGIILVNFGYNLIFFDQSVGQTQNTMLASGLFLLFGLPRIILIIFFVFQDIGLCFLLIFNRSIIGKKNNDKYLPSRRKFIMYSGLSVAAIPFFGLLYGIIHGKYNFKVIKKKLVYSNLPKSFDGFKILQISDIHSGSFDNKKKIEHAIDLINQQDFDIFLFTGDIVNNFHWEMNEWYDAFSKIKKAPYGNYAVLGNHDYGEYTEWDSEDKKQQNFEKIKAIFPKIGVELLLNENRFIYKDTQRIALIGVQNWGVNFKKLGDLKVASEGVDISDFKILMSHDPSHWDKVVKLDSKRYDLTLSGHTHGMQLGIEIPKMNLKWSPIQYVYPQWAGFYNYQGRIINVNRGFGYHFFSGRAGIWPEITIIELKNS